MNVNIIVNKAFVSRRFFKFGVEETFRYEIIGYHIVNGACNRCSINTGALIKYDKISTLSFILKMIPLFHYPDT